MSCQKRKPDKEDREKGSPNKAKRACFQDGSASSKTGSSQSTGKNARNYCGKEHAIHMYIFLVFRMFSFKYPINSLLYACIIFLR